MNAKQTVVGLLTLVTSSLAGCEGCDKKPPSPPVTRLEAPAPVDLAPVRPTTSLG